jgi:hypothetical protein
VQDRILTEVIQRERFEEFQKTAYLGRVLGLLWGADPEALRRAEEVLEFAIYQTAWDPEHIRRHLENARRVAHQQREERLRDAHLLDRVASYSADDDDDLSFPAADRRQPKRAGVTDVWKRSDAD